MLLLAGRLGFVGAAVCWPTVHIWCDLMRVEGKALSVMLRLVAHLFT